MGLAGRKSPRGPAAKAQKVSCKPCSLNDFDGYGLVLSLRRINGKLALSGDLGLLLTF